MASPFRHLSLRQQAGDSPPELHFRAVVVRKCRSLRAAAPVPDPNHFPPCQHGHLDYPPAPGNFFELPAGDIAIAQTACNMGATKYWQYSEGSTDIRDGENPCPGYPMAQYHVSLFRTLIRVLTADLLPLGVTEYVARYLLFLSRLT